MIRGILWLTASWQHSGDHLQTQIDLLGKFPVARQGSPAIRPYLVQGDSPAVPVTLLDEHHRLDRGGHPRRTYKKALERFAHDYLATLKPMTQVRYRASFRQLASVLDTLYLDEITCGRLADYASARMKGGPKGATVRRDLAALSCLCSCAVAWDYIDANPVKQFSKRHIKESRHRTTYPTSEQVDRLVTHSSLMAGRTIRFLAEECDKGGLRAGMVAGVNPASRGQVDQNQDL